MSTIETTLTGGIPLVNFDKVPAIPRCLIFELGHELRPAHVMNRFGKGMVLDHVLHRQTLDTDRLVVTNQMRREFVQEITATISDPGMNASNFLAGFLSVLGTFSKRVPSRNVQFHYRIHEQYTYIDVTAQKGVRPFLKSGAGKAR